MAVKRNSMAQALTKPQTVQRAALTVPNINTTGTTLFGNSTDIFQNSASAQQDAFGQALINKAVSGQGFDPKGGVGVAVAQIATAGIGAWAQNTARKEIAEKEVGRQQQLSSLLTSKGYTPESASAIASMTTPESGSSIIGSFISQDMAKNDPATQLSLQKSQAEISKLNAETNKVNREAAGVGSPDIAKVFDNTSKLRESLINNSKEFQGIKAGFEKVKISASDPSPAGDISMIFAFMKTLDPNSTVREGEAATVANAGSIDSRTTSFYNRTLSGEKLPPEVRADFVDRATKLYNQAAKSQEKTNNQYRKIAIRNKLNPEDVIVDFATTLEQPPAQLSGQSIAPQKTGFQILNVRDK